MEKLLVTREKHQLKINIPKLSTPKAWLYYDYESEVNSARPYLNVRFLLGKYFFSIKN